MAYETILYEEDGPVGTMTLNRPDDGNMFTETMCHEVRDCINAIRRETRTRVMVLTGAGDRFFCIGGRKDRDAETQLYAGVLPTLDMYETIERLQKPVIASVNGYAVGGGNVLQVMCDITIAKESAVFRQVGPMMGSFDAGYGTWYLEDLVGKKKAKEIWFRNPRLSAREALEIGMINKVVPDDRTRGRNPRDGIGNRRARRLCAGRDQDRVQRPPRRRRRPGPLRARHAVAPLSGKRGIARTRRGLRAATQAGPGQIRPLSGFRGSLPA